MARTLLVGFDGATLDLCSRWIADGRMPTLAALMAEGSYGELRSTLPYNSAVAWTSLATGRSPGGHGVYDFVLPREDAYGYRVATREDRRVPALWNAASAAGARVGIVNIPMTFPAEEVSGVMVSGMDAPLLDERAVSPAGFLDELRSIEPGYRIISNAHLAAAQGDFARAERELVGVLEARGRFTAGLAERRDLDLLMVNLEATDGSHHFFWEHHDPTHPRHRPDLAGRFSDTIGRVYAATDRELRRLLDAFQPDTTFVVSDHGGGPSSDHVLFLNDWLASVGLLHATPARVASVGRRLYGAAKDRVSVPVRRRLRPLIGQTLERMKGAALFGDFDWSRSRAYAHMQPALRVNLAGREPQGCVRRSEREAVLGEAIERAAELRLPDGAAAVVSAAKAEDVYGADPAPGGPDLVLELAPGLHVRSRNTTGKAGFLLRLDQLGMYLPSGVHTRTGMVVAAGAGVARMGKVEPSDILQVAPSVLASLDVEGPVTDMGVFDFLGRTYSTAGGPGDVAPPGEESGATDLSAAEEAEVVERLRGLGYVD